MTKKEKHLKAAHKILITLGMPRAQQNDRSALCLLALLNLIPGKTMVKS
jgi:type II restriction enzyme